MVPNSLPNTVAVRTRGLTLAYGDHVAVRDADLDLPAGAVTAVIGPNGSGKSTLLAAIGGLVRPRRGTIEVLGRSPDDAHDQVAHVLQNTVANDAVPLTVREVVQMGRYAQRGAFGRLTAEDRATIDEAMDRLGVADLRRRHIRELSGGQRQRVYVAQGLAQRAEVLLLDEPVTGLDIVTQEAIERAIADERDAGHTIVVTTHDVGSAAAADHVVILNTEVVACGAPSDVLDTAALGAAFGGHVHVLDDGTVVVDETHQHH